jgi:LmbE family N-acetylglucosaminyl deacetylase
MLTTALMPRSPRDQPETVLDVPGHGDRILVLAPHPDDESLAAGGLLARAASCGAAARVIFVTDGDNAPWTQRIGERRWRIRAADRRRFGQRRQREAIAAIERLGLTPADAVFLHHPDQGITPELLRGDERLVHELASELDTWRPTLLVTPSPFDLHPDHSAVAVFARLALSASTARPHPRVLDYLVHGSPRWSPDLAVLRLTTEERQRKRDAIACHVSQLVVHRRAYLGMARELERFAVSSSLERHVVRDAALTGRLLECVLSSRRRPGAWGRRQLLVVAPGEHGRDTLRARVRSGRSPLARPIAGDERGHVEITSRGPVRALRIECDALARAACVFVKVDRRFGFFDEAGWIEIPQTQDRSRAAASPRTDVHSREPRVCVVIPCFNVAGYCREVVGGALDTGATVIAVDDGSTDGTADALRSVTSDRLQILTSDQNRGKGAALLEAFACALRSTPFDVLVTIDGDGQHRPEDIPSLVRAWQHGAELAIGERQLAGMPPRRRFGNDYIAECVRGIYPNAPADTQSGFRAHDRSLVASVVAHISGSGYETELRTLLLALAQGRRIAAVPIPTLYLDGNRASHFRTIADSYRIWRAVADACFLPPFMNPPAIALVVRRLLARPGY